MGLESADSFAGTFCWDFCRHVYIWLTVHSCWSCLVSYLSLLFWARLHRSPQRGTLCVSTLACMNSFTHRTTSYLSCLSLFAQVLQAQLLQIPGEMIGTLAVMRCVTDNRSEKPLAPLGYHISWELTTEWMYCTRNNPIPFPHVLEPYHWYGSQRRPDTSTTLLPLIKEGLPRDAWEMPKEYQKIPKPRKCWPCNNQGKL